LERRKTPAYAAIALARLRDGDRGVVQRKPTAFVDLHAHHVGVAQPWICIHSDRTSRARRAGTSTVTLDVVPFSPTTSTGRVTVVPAVATLAKHEVKTATA